MQDKKTNKERVKDYHAKLVNIMVRRLPAPNEQAGIEDYKQMITQQAANQGLSVNAYILGLIEKDMGISIPKGIKDTKR